MAEQADFTPIGFELLDHRLSSVPVHKRSGIEYKNKVQAASNQLRTALEMAGKYRGFHQVSNALRTPAQTTKQESSSCKQQRKRKFVTPSNPNKRARKNSLELKRTRPCCAKWCENVMYLPNCVPMVLDMPQAPQYDEGMMSESQVAELRMKYEKKLDNWYIARFKRNEILERLGLGKKQPINRQYRFCGCHETEFVVGKHTKRQRNDGTSRSIRIPEFEAPIATGGKGFQTPTKSSSKGVGSDRLIFRHVTETRNNNEFALALQQTHEMEDIRLGKHGLNDINKRVVEAAGLDVHFAVVVTPQEKDHQNDTQGQEADVRPSIKPNDLTPTEVKRRTGFMDLPSLLSFAAVMCDGDLNCLFETCSKMTWLEEWMFLFEFEYGRTACRWSEYAKIYNCSRMPLRKVLTKKLKILQTTRERWPMYASYEEDSKYRSDKWNSHFDKRNGSRVIMHDATGLVMPCPSKTEQQRALFSEYYGTTCAKGGVSNQLCGWIRAIPLFTGRITDSQMIKDSNILEMQRLFQEADSSSEKPFTNVFDKGFRNALDASMEKQLCMQPKYAKGDRQFRGKDTLHSACVAVIRSGNERAVQRCKMSWFLKRGCAYQLWDIDLLCDIWEGWAFQTNFMYDKFL